MKGEVRALEVLKCREDEVGKGLKRVVRKTRKACCERCPIFSF